MLRKNYIESIKRNDAKSIYDDEEFENKLEDENYLLNSFKPLKESQIRSIPKNDLDNFIDNVLTDKNVNELLFSSNGKTEIKLIKKATQSITSKKHIVKEKKEINPQDLVIRREREETIKKIVDEANTYKKHKRQDNEDLKQKNYAVYQSLYKNHHKEEEKRYLEYLDEVRKYRFLYIFEKIKEKLKKDHINLPNSKLSMDNVYSRLYHNAVFVKKKEEGGDVDEPGDDKTKKNKTKLNVKNVIQETSGKEFSIKITEKEYMKCFVKYSGGPNMELLEDVRVLLIYRMILRKSLIQLTCLSLGMIRVILSSTLLYMRNSLSLCSISLIKGLTRIYRMQMGIHASTLR
jgi:hypothetical protein